MLPETTRSDLKLPLTSPVPLAGSDPLMNKNSPEKLNSSATIEMLDAGVSLTKPTAVGAPAFSQVATTLASKPSTAPPRAGTVNVTVPSGCDVVPAKDPG